jgi:D-sedoheptulose 7-phosphate isomerase
MMPTYERSLSEAVNTFISLEKLGPVVAEAAALCINAINSGNKLLLCGNGGSSSEAQHLAAELMGRYKQHRRALPAVALSADPAVLTCIGNDFCFDDIFARQLEALAVPGDILIVFTTSGRSMNVVRALETARDRGVRSIAFLGSDGGKALSISHCVLLVLNEDTARVQEAHQFLMHCLMDRIEAGLIL